MAHLQEQLAEANLRQTNLQQQVVETSRPTKRMRHHEPFVLSRVIASEAARRARVHTFSSRDVGDSIACEHCCGVGVCIPGCIRLRRGVYARVHT